MNRLIRPLLAAALSLALGLLLYAAGSRDEFPSRRQGGGSHGHAEPVFVFPI